MIIKEIKKKTQTKNVLETIQIMKKFKLKKEGKKREKIHSI